MTCSVKSLGWLNFFFLLFFKIRMDTILHPTYYFKVAPQDEAEGYTPLKILNYIKLYFYYSF